MTRIHGITTREWEVAERIGDCESVKTIAGALGISVFTVHGHIDHIVLAWDLNPTKPAQSQIALRVADIRRATAA